MNETLRTMATRYSCRAYEAKPVEREKLQAVAEAAVQSPSGMNRQPWKIAVITDKAFIDEMDAAGMKALSQAADKTAYERMMGRGGKLFYNAPCMFVILKQPGNDLDCGIVSQNIALAATSLGLGNVICGMAGMPFAGENGADFRSRAVFEEGYEFGMAVLVGYAAADGTPHEPDMGKVYFVE